MPRVFISYRRNESRDIVGRIFDRLVTSFHRKAIFKDVDSIGFGADFRATIETAISGADVVLAVIGPAWLGEDAARGTRRIDDPDDFVRIEIRAALRSRVRIIPVLVNDASLPEPEALPDDIRALTAHQTATVRADPDFEHDVTRLMDEIRPPRRWIKPAGMAGALAATTLALALVLRPGSNPRLRAACNDLNEALAAYDLAASNLRDSFNDDLPMVLDGNKQAEDHTAGRIVAYNAAYGKIRKNRSALASAVVAEAPKLSGPINHAFDLALDRLHPRGVLALNPLRVRIDRYATSSRAGPDAQAERADILGAVRGILDQSGGDLAAFRAAIADLRKSPACNR